MHENSKVVVVEARGLQYKTVLKTVLEGIDFQIFKGEVLVITGSSGSGKTSLLKVLNHEIKSSSGYIFFKKDLHKVLVSQQDHFITSTSLRTTYYSQRYENPNQDGIPTVRSFLSKWKFKNNESGFLKIVQDLELHDVLERKLLSLSNGERKRLQLASSLMQNPDLLLLDQPFTGLDVLSRKRLDFLLHQQKNKGTTLVLVCDKEHIPEYADTVLELSGGKISHLLPLEKYKKRIQPQTLELFSQNKNFESLVEPGQNYKRLVRMRNVNVFMGGVQVLRNINWEIKPGEKWVLKGPNGAGKTTLLSLISADNPQGYSNDLVLFDKKRGSGESIWDIKKKIGFVSPELHLYFLRIRGNYKPASGTSLNTNSMTCLEVILSGFKDEIGFNSTASKLHIQKAKLWLQVFCLEHLEKSAFVYVSLGEQRLILLARSLVKSPDLLILDEPCQGLDVHQTRRFTTLLNQISAQHKTTFIYVTHRAEEIPACVTKIIELEKGEVVKYGNWE